jgi:hypothetical protein
MGAVVLMPVPGPGMESSMSPNPLESPSLVLPSPSLLPGGVHSLPTPTSSAQLAAVLAHGGSQGPSPASVQPDKAHSQPAAAAAGGPAAAAGAPGAAPPVQSATSPAHAANGGAGAGRGGGRGSPAQGRGPGGGGVGSPARSPYVGRPASYGSGQPHSPYVLAYSGHAHVPSPHTGAVPDPYGYGYAPAPMYGVVAAPYGYDGSVPHFSYGGADSQGGGACGPGSGARMPQRLASSAGGALPYDPNAQLPYEAAMAYGAPIGAPYGPYGMAVLPQVRAL